MLQSSGKRDSELSGQQEICALPQLHPLQAPELSRHHPDLHLKQLRPRQVHDPSQSLGLTGSGCPPPPPAASAGRCPPPELERWHTVCEDVEVRGGNSLHTCSTQSLSGQGGQGRARQGGLLRLQPAPPACTWVESWSLCFSPLLTGWHCCPSALAWGVSLDSEFQALPETLCI